MPLSQSSETNQTLNVPFAAGLAHHGIKRSHCLVCKDKPTIVFTEGCIYNQFCFCCIKKQQRCPICEELITGSNRIASKLFVNAMTGLFSTSPTSSRAGPHRELVAGFNKEGGCMNVEDKLEEVPMVDQGANDGTYSSDEDDQGIHWSNDDVFREGGVRSVLGSSRSEEPKTIISAPSVGLCQGHVETRTSLDKIDSYGGPHQAIDELLPKPNRSSVRVHVVTHEENSKRRMEKSLTDLFGVPPPTALKAKVGIKRPSDAIGDNTSKKKVGRPRNPSKSLTSMKPNSRSTTRCGRVLLKLRD